MPTLTEVVHDELGGLPVARRCCRRAEIATVLRLSAALRRLDGRVQVEADLGVVAARRLRVLITSAFAYAVRLQALPAPGPGRRGRYRVSVDGAGGAELARRVGLLTGHDQLVGGLPPQVIGGPVCDAAAVWRAAVLTSGHLSRPGHRAPLEVSPADHMVALALVGTARRLGVTTRSVEVRGRWRVAVHDEAQVVVLLDRIGAAAAARGWQQNVAAQPAWRPAPALGSTGANLQRAALAALAATARVRAALAILGEDAPAHLLNTGRLRLAHPQARLEELGARADPPMSKDAVAGRIRRLLALADARAAATGRPPTHDSVPAAEVLDPSDVAAWAATPAAAAGCA